MSEWMPFIYILGAIGLFLLYEHIKFKRSGLVGGMQMTHISGLPDIEKDIKVIVDLYPDRLIIDSKQILPIERIKSTEAWSSKTMTESQKSIVGRALFGTLVGGGIGGVIGGMSGVGSEKTQRDCWYFSIEYTNKNNDDSIILFRVDHIFESGVRDFSKYINEKIGHQPIKTDKQYEI